MRKKKKYSNIVKITEGKVIGEILQSKDGVTYQAFNGISYAQKPVGTLRFLPPQVPTPFTDIYKATKKDIKCVQKDVLGFIVGNEDCLYLNIYVPTEISKCNQSKSYPVMVYIHGGGFNSGSAGPEVYGPDYFMNFDVILVTMNYRVGALGFLTLGNDTAPGNLGLRDQQQCMSWIMNNIAAFGGDENNITLFGESAGAISCGIHLISPRSKGLFHKMIAQSGSFWDFQQLSVWKPNNGVRLAKELGYKGDIHNTDEILLYLQKIDHTQLIRTALSFDADDTTHTFTPCVDNYSTDPVMPEHAFKILEEGNYNQVPIIHGVCRDEGMVFSYMCDNTKDAWRRMNDNWESLGMLKLFNLPHEENNESLSKVICKIKNYYYGEKYFGSDTFENYSKLGGDRVFHAQCHLTCLLLSKTSSKPVFRYIFNHEGKHSLLKSIHLSKWKLIVKVALKYLFAINIFNGYKKGVCHADDMIYLFKNMYGMNSDECSDDISVRNHMLKIWTHFARYGVPFDNIKEWPPYSYKNPYSHYEISTNCGIKYFEDDYKDRLNFWLDSVIPVLRKQ